MQRFKCLYTTRLTQREKRFQEGFVDIDMETCFIKLISATREVLATAHFIDDIPLDGSDFRIENFLVEIDSDQDFSNITTASDVPPTKPPPTPINRSYRKAPQGMQNISQSRRAPSKFTPPGRIERPPKEDSHTQIPIENSEVKIQVKKKLPVVRDVPRTWDEILAFYSTELNTEVKSNMKRLSE